MDGKVLWNLGLSVYHPKRTSDWDRGTEAGRKECGKARKGNFAMIGRVCVWFLEYSSSTFLKVKLATDWYVTWPKVETFIFHPLARPQRTFPPWRTWEGRGCVLFCGLWDHGSYNSLKVHQICNRLIYNMTIFVKPHLSPKIAPVAILPRGGIFSWFWAYGSHTFLKV